jgi:hypothetical protein
MKKEKKKKYVRPSADAERDALAWATNVFREKRAELEKGYIEAHLGEAKDELIELHDRSSRNGTDPFLPLVAGGPFPELLRDISATLLERDKQLPPELVGFAATSLREPSRPERPGPKERDLIARDMVIGSTVRFVKGKWGFKRTRSRFNTRDACAVSIVRKALQDAVNLNLSEADIIRASNKAERFLVAFAKSLVEKSDLLLPFLQEQMKRAHNSKTAQLLGEVDMGMDYLEKSSARLEYLRSQPEFKQEFKQFQQLVQDGELDNIEKLKERLRRKN